MAYRIDLKVTPDELKNAASSVTNLVGTLRRDFDSLQERVSRTSYYWVGPAGDEYREEFAALKDDTQELLNLLSKYPGDLLSMAQIYESTESAVQQQSAALPTDII